MSRFEKIHNFWSQNLQVPWKSTWIDRLHTGQLDLPHYMGFLLETYHNTGYNPQLQAYASMYAPGNPREVVKKFYQHAISEIGHDELALSDLEALNVDRDFILKSKPLPITTAFFANTVWGIQRKGPAYYLGYLFHLEFSALATGKAHLELLKAKGIPPQATKFLEEHALVDIAHTKFMELYVAELIKTDEQEEIMKESITTCIDLHTRMLCAAFENGEHLFGVDLNQIKATS